MLAAWELIPEDPLRDARAIVRPVPGSSSKTWGWLAAVPVDSPLGEFDEVALERAVGLVALALLRVRQETLLATRERGNFLFDLISGRTSMSDAAARAAALGFDSRSGALLPVVLVPQQADRRGGLDGGLAGLPRGDAVALDPCAARLPGGRRAHADRARDRRA